MRSIAVTLAAVLVSVTACASNVTAPVQSSQFYTLGTNAGPNPEANRSQAANALVVKDDLYLVDAGDGAVGQLARAGLRLQEVDGLFISHNHFDHTGGVLAVLGLRSQLNVAHTLKVYGPPGTKAFIAGLLAGMAPAEKAAFGMPRREWKSNVEVEEVVQGSIIELNGMTVLVAENTHFAIPQASGMPEKAKALSFRFNLEDRSIVYTGDTGPSEALEKLAKGADLLVSEMMDIDAILKYIQKQNPGMPERQLAGIEWHLRAHHLLPKQVGELALKTGAKKLVVTHMAPDVTTQEMAKRYLDEIAEFYKGPAVIANDLDSF
ncbi:MAG: MBL fold metallo-hydrolase [Gammaproteobacteria bacterium]